MRYGEVKCDLFTIGKEYHLAHCISADFALGAGIAVQFNKRFGIKNQLRKKYPGYVSTWRGGDCILEGNVLNLVTKQHYWSKPTYQNLEEALVKMRNVCEENNIKRVGVPMIGCGLDRLNWNRVSSILKHVFVDTDIEILVCRL